MPIVIDSGFKITSAGPADTKTIWQSSASLYTSPISPLGYISSSWRYEGMKVYCIDNKSEYQLQGGVSDNNWIRLTSGSVTLSSSYSSTATGGTTLVTGSFYPISSSWAQTASFATNAGTEIITGSYYPITSSHSVTSSYLININNSIVALSSSYALSASVALTASNVSVANTAMVAFFAANTIHTDSSSIAVSASYSTTAGYVTTASNATNSSYALSSSIATNSDYAKSSSYATNTGYALTSSLSTNTGVSISASYSISSSFATTASYYAGTASFAINAGYSPSSSVSVNSGYSISSSVSVNSTYSISSSYSNTSSYCVGTSSFSNSASYAFTASFYYGTASVAINSIYANTASFATTASYYTGTASFAINAGYANTASFAITASHYPGTSSFAINAGYANTASFAITASYYPGTASFAINAGTSLSSSISISSSYALSASYYSGSVVYAQFAGYVTSASFADLASYVPSASYVTHVGNVSSVGVVDNVTQATNVTTVGYAASVSSIQNANTATNVTNVASVGSANLINTAITAQLVNTASSVGNITSAISASTVGHVDSVTTVGYVQTASFFNGTASYTSVAGYAPSASYAITTSFFQGTSSFSITAGYTVSSSYAVSASITSVSSYAESSDFATNTLNAQNAQTAQNSYFSLYATQSSFADTATLATSASYALTSSYYPGTASFAINSGYAATSSVALLVGYSISASIASSSYSSSYSISASYALTASQANLSQYIISSSYALSLKPSASIILTDITVGGTASFFGPLNAIGGVDQSTSVAGVTIGKEAGTGRAIFCDGVSNRNWLIDQYLNVFRWYQPGLVYLALSTRSLMVGGQAGEGLNRLAVLGSAAIGNTYVNYSAPSNGLIVEGKVAIGKTSATNSLDVVGNISCSVITASLFYGVASNSTSASYALTASYSLNGGGQQGSSVSSSWASSSLSASYVSGLSGGSANYIPLWSTNSNLSSSIITQIGNKIGINNSNPTGSLHLNITSSTTIGILIESTSSQSSNIIEWRDDVGVSRFVVSPSTIPSVTMDSGYISIKPGNRDYFIGTYDAGGTMFIGRSDVINAMKIIPSALGITFGAYSGYINLVGNTSNGMILTPYEGGGIGTLQIGRRISDSSAGVGSSTEFWTYTGQTAPAITVKSPGGIDDLFQVMPSGQISSSIISGSRFFGLSTSSSYALSASYAPGGGGGGTTLVTGSSYPVTSSWSVSSISLGGGIMGTISGSITYYVTPTGSNSNNGLSQATPFQTIQYAIDTITSNFISSGTSVAIQVNDGTYVGTVNLRKITGGGTITLQGNAGTPANVSLQATSSTCVSADGVGTGWTLKDFRLGTATAGHLLSCTNKSSVNITGLNFNQTGAGWYQIYALDSTVTAIGNYSVSSGAGRHLSIEGNGLYNAAGRTITFSNSPAYSIYAFAYASGVIYAQSMTFTNGGTVTGTRYDSEANSVIYTSGGGANYFPGNGAGTTATGGQYI